MTGTSKSVASDAAIPVSCEVTERRIDDVCVLSVSGTIDVLTVPQLETAIAAAAATPSAGLVIDLNDVDFLASVGMGLLVAAHARLTPATRFVLVADGAATSRPLKLVGIADVIDLFPTLDEALAAVASS